MTVQHSEPLDIGVLYEYLESENHGAIGLDDLIATIMEEPDKVKDVMSDVSRVTEAHLKYERESPFGRTRTEIRENAGMHLPSCANCMQQYISIVEAKGIVLYELAKKVLASRGVTTIPEPIKYIAQCDLLSLLRLQDVNPNPS